MLTLMGKVTGGGPRDKEEREALYRVGWQPYSLRLGENYYSFSRLEPVGSIFGMAADYTEMMLSAKAGQETLNDYLVSMVYSFSKNISSKTFLTGLIGALDAITSPERNAGTFIERFAGTLIPTGVATVARAQEKVFRQVEGPVESIKSRIPGETQKLRPKINIWGEEVARPGTAAGRLLSPIAVSRPTPDRVDSEMVRLGLGMAVPRGALAGVRLTPEEYESYLKQSGKAARKAVERLMDSFEYRRAKDEDRVDLIQSRMRRARASIADRMVTRMGRARRVAAKAERRKPPVIPGTRSFLTASRT
jgi:hypothetical protein